MKTITVKELCAFSEKNSLNSPVSEIVQIDISGKINLAYHIDKEITLVKDNGLTIDCKPNSYIYILEQEGKIFPLFLDNESFKETYRNNIKGVQCSKLDTLMFELDNLKLDGVTQIKDKYDKMSLLNNKYEKLCSLKYQFEKLKPYSEFSFNEKIHTQFGKEIEKGYIADLIFEDKIREIDNENTFDKSNPVLFKERYDNYTKLMKKYDTPDKEFELFLIKSKISLVFEPDSIEPDIKSIAKENLGKIFNFPLLPELEKELKDIKDTEKDISSENEINDNFDDVDDCE
jgi:hypothetical protein